MNRKGFTLIELIATLLVLSLVVGLTVYSVSGIFKNTKDKTEDVFVETIKDALEIYLSSDAKSLKFNTTCSNSLNKTHGIVSVSKTMINFNDVIDSRFKPIKEEDMVNPAKEEIACSKDFEVTIYKDKDNVYYYSFNRYDLVCLNNMDGIISNLPEGFVC